VELEICASLMRQAQWNGPFRDSHLYRVHDLPSPSVGFRAGVHYREEAVPPRNPERTVSLRSKMTRVTQGVHIRGSRRREKEVGSCCEDRVVFDGLRDMFLATVNVEV
jgi:hypothetical protein